MTSTVNTDSDVTGVFNPASPGTIGGTNPGPITGTSVTATGLSTQAAEDSITAFAGGGKASATVLSATKNLHRISVCATAADSVLMPPALAGQIHELRNDGAAACQVFGQGTDTINGVATGTGVSLPLAQTCYLACHTAGAWQAIGVGPFTATAFASDSGTNLTVSAGSGGTLILRSGTTVVANIDTLRLYPGSATIDLGINTNPWRFGYFGTVTAQGGNGQSLALQQLTELTTIAAAATTDTTIQMPAGAIVLAVNVRVTTVIPTAASFTVGDSGSAARFSTAAVSSAATSTDKGTKAGAYYNSAALSVRITPDVQPAAATGVVRVTIFYLASTPPTS